nr:unnamed protein product [Callosobruchus chinensis]
MAQEETFSDVRCQEGALNSYLQLFDLMMHLYETKDVMKATLCLTYQRYSINS